MNRQIVLTKPIKLGGATVPPATRLTVGQEIDQETAGWAVGIDHARWADTQEQQTPAKAKPSAKAETASE